MNPVDLSPLAPWVGRTDFEALAVAAARAPEDDAPRLVLANWLRDRRADAAADLVAGARGVFGGWLAMLRYEQKTGRSADRDMPHLTDLFDPRSTSSLDGAVDAARRAAAALILARADGQQPARLSSV
jgi:hypothetical protein